MGDYEIPESQQHEWQYNHRKTCRHPDCSKAIGNRAKVCNRHAYWYRVNITQPAQRLQAAVRKIKHLPGDMPIVTLGDLHGCANYVEVVDRIRATVEDYAPRLIRQWWANS